MSSVGFHSFEVVSWHLRESEELQDAAGLLLREGFEVEEEPGFGRPLGEEVDGCLVGMLQDGLVGVERDRGDDSDYSLGTSCFRPSSAARGTAPCSGQTAAPCRLRTE